MMMMTWLTTVLTTSGLSKELEDSKSQVLAKRDTNRYTIRYCPSVIVVDDPAFCDTQHCAFDGGCAGDLKCCPVGEDGCNLCVQPGDVTSIFNQFITTKSRT